MNNLQEFTNGDIKLPVRTNENGDIEFDAERAAIGLGISTVAKSGNVISRAYFGYSLLINVTSVLKVRL